MITDTEIETFSFLFIMGVGILTVGGTVGWWLFLQVFRIVDNYMQDRQFRKMGWDKVIDKDGQVWYVGYDNHP